MKKIKRKIKILLLMTSQNRDQSLRIKGKVQNWISGLMDKVKATKRLIHIWKRL